MRKIIVWAYKGGIGKTTLAVNLAAALSKLGLKVLLIDLDPQGHSSVYVGRRASGAGRAGLVRVLALEGAQAIADAAEATDHGFDVLTGSDELLRVERELRDSAVGADFYLRDALAAVPAGRWDVVVMDAGPSKGLLTTLGLVAADSLIVPQPLESMALAGLADARRHLALVKRANPKLQFAGIVINRPPKKDDSQAKKVRIALAKHCADELMQTVIRQSSYYGDAYDHQKPVPMHAPQSIATADLEALVQELGERGVL